jgi:ribulose 1,5-bisphosphate synthetase/thiazole synthase
MNITRRKFVHSTSVSLSVLATSSFDSGLQAADSVEADVCVYGATASGIAAALGVADAVAKSAKFFTLAKRNLLQ